MADLITAEEAAERLREATTGIQYVVLAADGLTIDSQADVETAGEMLAQLKAVLDEIETKRKELSLPLTRVARQINEAAREAAGPASSANGVIRSKLREYAEKVAAAAAAEKAIAQEATGQEIVDPSTVAPERVARTVTASGSLTMRERWTFDVVDVLKLAEHAIQADDPGLILPAMTAINAFVKAGGRDLPGVRIYKTADPTVKAS
jgi:hypothetical protein